MLRAAIDVGTNSVLALLADVQTEGGRKRLRVVWEDEALTRLGEGVHESGLLKPEAIDRTVEAVARFVGKARAGGAKHIRVVATSAAREAGNCNLLKDEIKRKTGLELAVLSGEEEARAAFIGARAGLSGTARPCVVVDVGGGSTEVIYGVDQPELSQSLRIGAVRLTELFLRHDPYVEDEWLAMQRHVADTLSEFPLERLDRSATTVGIGGTATTLAMLELGLTAYDADSIHGVKIPAARFQFWAEKLAKMTRAERAKLPGIPPLRADVLPAGVLIFAEFLKAGGFESMTVSTFGIRHGVLLE